jgi:hypothetical protein
MDECKAARYRGDGEIKWFPEVFVCNIPGRTIQIKVFQPLFIALDELRRYGVGYLNRSQLTEKFLRTVRPDYFYISFGLDKCWWKQTDTVKKKYNNDKYEFAYQCIRSLVFEEDGNTCVVSLDMIEEVVNLPETGSVFFDDNLVAVMALYLWKNSHAGLSDRIQQLQQSPLELHRKAASVFTTMLHPLVHTFREVFPESDPLLYSTRKRCTHTQINKLKRDLASNDKQCVSATSTSLMSLSTSFAFCKHYESLDCDDPPRCPMMLTVKVQSTEVPMFIPVFDYVREDTERNKEYEVLMLPGAKMVFSNIQPAEIEKRTGKTTADLEIIGMDASNILTQQEIAISNRVVTMVMAGIDLGTSAYA